MSLRERFSRLLGGDASAERSARRRLRYMRLERRFLLSGDLGETFEVDDDDLEDFDEIELWQDDDESEYEDHDEYDDDDDDRVIVVQSFHGEDFEVPAEDSTSDDDFDPRQLEDEASNSSTLTSDVEAEGESGSLEATSLEEQVTLSDVLRPNELTSDDVVSEVDLALALDVASIESIDPPNQSSVLLQATADASTTLDNGAEQNLALVEQADFNFAEADVAIRAEANANVPTIQDHLPIESTPSENDEFNASGITWLGSFADDLSAVDEALRELLDRHMADEAIGGVLRTGPLIAGGLITSGFAAQMAYQKARKQQSRLEDDHCSVQFDMRHYPELFG